ncbi:MAG: hypothetical protein Ct9H90mP2_02310 [Dehalococcoidia bacterium]|nr:MAG: hypothetical protein Ct9H90mP2_02310 [Dehalococcoidia bacterium]
MESAHNLLAAMVDNNVYRSAIKDFYPENITWRRVTDAEDRSLRNVIAGAGKNTSPFKGKYRFRYFCSLRNNGNFSSYRFL